MRCAKLGATVHVGHDPRHLDHLGADDTVVVSTAVKPDNPEHVEAHVAWSPHPLACGRDGRADGRPPRRRGRRHPRQDDDDLAADRRAAGGRSRPDLHDRRRAAATGVNAAEGTGGVFVAEADESDGAFLAYHPYAAIVTNVEADHLDHWRTEEAYTAAFDEFADPSTPDPGFLVCCVDDGGAAALADRQRAAGRHVITVSTRAGRDLGPDALHGRPALVTRRPLPRRRAGGLRRRARPRFPTRRPAARPRVVHRHPSPDGAQGRGRRRPRLRQLRPPPDRDRGRPASGPASRATGRVVVVFQPHLVSRTRAFGDRHGRGARRRRRGRGLDVYLAREAADPAVTGALVADAVPLPAERVAFVPAVADVAAARADAGPARRPGADARCRRRHRGRTAGAGLLAQRADG